MRNETRDELLLAVADAVIAYRLSVEITEQNGMSFRLRELIELHNRAKAENTVRAANEVIEATERSEC